MKIGKARLTEDHNWRVMLEEKHQRTALLGDIAHDLRSPLNTIVGSLTLMVDGQFGEVTSDQRTWINRSLAATQQILRLATDVLELTNLEQGHHLSFNANNIDPTPLLKQTLSLAEGLKGYESVVQLTLDIPDDLPDIVADADRVHQILLNLIGNAFKFTSEGAVVIRAKPTADDRYLMISVSDTGTGIPEGDLALIFERFGQANNQDKGHHSGSGLGLAICKQLVELHGGKIGVANIESQGTMVWFTLPLSNYQQNTQERMVGD